MAHGERGSDVAIKRPSVVAGPSFVRYLVVWLALLALTILTYALSRLDLGPWSVVIALAIASTKTALVALFFMHLWDERGSMSMSLIVSVLFVIVLIGFTIADVTERFDLERPNVKVSVPPSLRE